MAEQSTQRFSSLIIYDMMRYVRDESRIACKYNETCYTSKMMMHDYLAKMVEYKPEQMGNPI